MFVWDCQIDIVKDDWDGLHCAMMGLNTRSASCRFSRRSLREVCHGRRDTAMMEGCWMEETDHIAIHQLFAAILAAPARMQIATIEICRL